MAQLASQMDQGQVAEYFGPVLQQITKLLSGPLGSKACTLRFETYSEPLRALQTLIKESPILAQEIVRLPSYLPDFPDENEIKQPKMYPTVHQVRKSV